jgi:hypothetical protein
MYVYIWYLIGITCNYQELYLFYKERRFTALSPSVDDGLLSQLYWTLMSVTGKTRYIHPNAFVLIHQLTEGSWGGG